MKTFKKGQRVIIISYVDGSLNGETGTVLQDSVPNNFDVVRLDKDNSVKYFWYTEIDPLQEA